MKKTTLAAAAVMLGVMVAASPLQALAAGPAQRINWPTKFVFKVFTFPCQPEVERPNLPEVEAPENNAPDVNVPENNAPDENVPENNAPETEAPGGEAGDQAVHEYVRRIVELVNEERVKAGLKALTLKEDITEAAQVRAVESETLFSHTRPDGTSFVTALKEAGVSYRGAGENIAWGQKTPEEVMKGWMNSPGHRANILNAKFTSIGVGYYQNAKGVNYWSQLFTYS